MANPKDIYNAARKGFLGHGALLDPDTYVNSVASSLGPMVAKNEATNELGFTDKMKVDMADLKPGDSGGGAAATTQKAPAPVRSKSQADLNERLMQQGYTPQQIMQREKNK